MTNLINLLIAILRGFFINVTDETKKSTVMSTINKLQAVRLHIAIQDSELSIDTKNNIHSLIDDIVADAGSMEVDIVQMLYRHLTPTSKRRIIKRSRYIARYKRNKFTGIYVVTLIDTWTNKKKKYCTMFKKKLSVEYIWKKFHMSVDSVDELMSVSIFKRYRQRHIYAKPIFGKKKHRISRNGVLRRVA